MPALYDMEPSSIISRRPHDELLSTPNSNRMEEACFIRAESTYINQDDRFKIVGRAYSRQYAQLYFARLTILGPLVRKEAEHRWPNAEVSKILDVVEDKEVVVVGTLFKSMKLKPSILDEYTKQRGTRAALGGTTSFTSDDDTLVLEDDGSRMNLAGNVMPVHLLVTGVVLAVRGIAEPGGDFVVSEFLVAGASAPPPRVLPLPSPDTYVAIVSGLNLGNAQSDALQAQLLSDYLMGLLGCPGEQGGVSSRVVRVIIAGPCVGANEALAAAPPSSRQQTVALQPVKDLDMYVSELSSSVAVDLMPGSSDPANLALPQPPFHPALLPACRPCTALVRATNPHAFTVEGVSFLGTSGQNLEDMAMVTRHEDRLAMLEDLLRWRHIAPTAPDTLACYPYHDTDPFIMHSAPHVFFAGNQPRFQTTLVTTENGGTVRAICIPRFSVTGTIALVNLNTLECQPLTFDTQVKTL